jgi:hypothetical protein
MKQLPTRRRPRTRSPRATSETSWVSVGVAASACVALAGQFVWGSVVANDTKRQGCRRPGTDGDSGGQQPGADESGACERVGSSSVERVEGNAGLDHGGSSDQDGGDGGGQQPGPEQSCSRQHVGSLRGGDLPPPLLRRNSEPRMDRHPTVTTASNGGDAQATTDPAVLSVGVAGGLLLGTAAAASACDLCWDEPEPPARGECSGGLCGTPSQSGGGGMPLPRRAAAPRPVGRGAASVSTDGQVASSLSNGRA